MKIRLATVLPLSLVLLLAAARSAEIDLTEPIPELKLKTGRVLRNATLKSFNSKTVFVKTQDKLIQVRYADFPDELQPLLAKAYNSTKAVNEYRPPPQKTETAPAASAGTKKAGPEESTVAANEAIAEKARLAEEKRLQLVKDAVREKATHYFRYEYDYGSGNSVIRSLSIELEEPEVASGWTGRYTLRGKCYAEYYDSYRASLTFGHTSKSFVATAEFDAKGKVKVVSFERALID
jgi:hypothetical protein